MQSRVLLAAIIAGALHASLTRGAQAEDRYYMMVFGTQSDLAGPRLTHTFAMFVKATDAKEPEARQLETQSISWMPRSLDIRVMARLPEPGANLTVEDSLRWADSVGAYTTMWGPFEVRAKSCTIWLRARSHS
jgi:hypothetical protein